MDNNIDIKGLDNLIISMSDKDNKKFDSEFTKILSKNACVDKENRCNFIKPYSYLRLFGTNPTTKKSYTEAERLEKEQQYKNMCSLSNTEIKRCCDKKDTKFKTLLEQDPLTKEVLGSIGDYKVKRIYENNKLVAYEKCEGSECDEEPTTAYDFCKLTNKDIVKTGTKVTNLTPDCYTADCGDANYVPFLRDPYQQDKTYVDDSRLFDAIKKGNLDYVENNFKESKDYSRVLKAGYPGNTTLHTAILYDADNIVEFLLKNKLDLGIQNKDGNSVLQIACLKGNTTLVYRLIKLGANIHDKNIYEDTPLHSAVRSGNLKTVVVLLSQSASVFPKNRFGETPLHTAVVGPKKNLEIIIQLVKMGSDLKTRNNNKHSIMKTLSLQKRTKKNEEIRTYLQNIYVTRYKDSYTELITDDPDASIVSMVDKNGKDDDIKKYDNLDKINISLPNPYITDKNLYKSKAETELPIKVKKGTDSSSNNENNENGNEFVPLIKETFEQFTNKAKADELVPNCNNFVYITTAVFLALLLILLILKYKK